MKNVVKRRLARERHLLPDDVLFAPRESRLYLLGREIAAGARIAAEGLFSLCGGLFLRMITEAAVGVSRLDELLGVFFVNLRPLALDIGTVVAANIVRPLVGNNARGIERAADEVNGVCDVAAAVGVLYAQDERPVVRARK